MSLRSLVAEFPRVSRDVVAMISEQVDGGSITRDKACACLRDMQPKEENEKKPILPSFQNDASLREHINARGHRVEDYVKIFVLGNTGRGKTFLCNCMLGSRVFREDYQSSSVTVRTEMACFESASGMKYVVLNIPGLEDVGSPGQQGTVKEVIHAFDVLPECTSVCLFVMNPLRGGRVMSDDLTTFETLASFASFEYRNVGFVANKFPIKEGGHRIVKSHYEEMKRLLPGRFGESQVFIAPDLDDEEDIPKSTRDIVDGLMVLLAVLEPGRVLPQGSLIDKRTRMQREIGDAERLRDFSLSELALQQQKK